MEGFVDKVFDPFKYNVEQIHDMLKTELDKEIKYCEKDIVYGKDILKKLFIIDIRNMNYEDINYIFENFDEIQRVLLSDIFLDYHEIEVNNKLSTYPYNLELIFLMDKNRNYNINSYKYIYNFDYALKSFMNEEEFNKYLTKQNTYNNINKEVLLDLKGKLLKLNHFNYIVGDNGSGKTRLLNEISYYLKQPVYSLDNFNLDLMDKIKNKGNINKFLYDLTDNVDFYSGFNNYAYRLSQILQYSLENNNIVLLDDLRWNGLDNLNLVKVVNLLKDYSYENTSVVLTGCDKSKWIKRKVYNANIINL